MSETLKIEEFDDETNLRKISSRFTQGTLWTLLSHLMTLLMRLGSNLILTRILAPEAFGLMLIINTFLMGIQFFSEIGLNVNVIHSSKGNSSLFLDSIWTIKVIRSVVLTIISCLLAWPISYVYQQPLLTTMFPVACLSILITGFHSTSLITLTKTLQLKKLMVIQLICQILSVVSTVTLAWFIQSVWALVFGGIINSLALLIFSHTCIKGYKNRFYFDKKLWLEIFHFGKWVFFATIVGFIAKKGDQLVLAKFMTISALGVYSIAYIISDSIIQGVTKLASKVLLPTYSLLLKDANVSVLKKIDKMRLLIFLLVIPPTCMLAVFSQRLIEFLYEVKYHDAGWILEVLTIGSIISVINLTIQPSVLARGDPYRQLILNLIRMVLLGISMTVGWYVMQVNGLIIGIAVTGYLFYPFVILMTRDYGLWRPGIDFFVLLFSFLLIWFGKTIFPY